ncbi:hypothetical protein BCON_0214g00030 [Botryotinia convoluta]|uniref:2EXR domain-containing protein n=1 Tax=Botryotinia convoluta TaxID=54673 RepID=A0A4Z1HJT9_9HELO|nr:hypothetical protein BCON_0214g00030 [Botryotinia convoluta]
MDISNTMDSKQSSGSVAKKSQTKKSRTKKPRAKKSRAVKKPQGVDQGTQTTVPPQLTEFTLFPKLPLEIRIKIWRSSFESRKVSLQGGCLGRAPPNQPLPFNYPFEQPAKDFFVYGPPFPAPIRQLPVAFVNRESRTETLLHYVRLHQDLHSPDKDGTNLKYPATIYFNPNLDIPLIYANKTQYAFNKMSVSCKRLFPSYDPRAVEILKSVRTIDIWFMGFSESDRWSYDMDSCRDALLMFENLKTIRIKDAIIHFNLDFILGPNLSFNFNPNPGSAFSVRSFVCQYFDRSENHPSVNGNPITLEYLEGTVLGPSDA